MFLDLTPDQIAFKAQIEQFARDVVAPRAAAIDAGGEFPSDVMQAAAGFGLLGVTVSTAWGGAGRDYLSYARSHGRDDLARQFAEALSIDGQSSAARAGLAEARSLLSNPR